MENKKLVNKYIKFNKLLLSTINIKTKKIDVFDGEKNMAFNYNDFFKYVSDYFDLNPDFIDKALMIINSLDSSNEVLEIKAEYKKKSGKVANFTYNFVKENDELFALFVKENQNTVEDHLDQMTKANPKAYIDNLGKNNILSKTPFILLYMLTWHGLKNGMQRLAIKSIRTTRFFLVGLRNWNQLRESVENNSSTI